MTARAARFDVGTKLQLGPQRPVPRPRLKEFDYKGRYAYHVVLTVKARSDVFRDLDFGNWCVSRLSESAKRTEFEVAAYCLMPDHVHLLVQGMSDSSRLVAFIQNFKQRTAFHFKRESGDQLWQQSYFDRVLRQDEDVQAVADYVFQNPVAGGLCDDPASYPLSGGSFFQATSPDRAKAPSLRDFQGVADRSNAPSLRGDNRGPP